MKKQICFGVLCLVLVGCGKSRIEARLDRLEVQVALLAATERAREAELLAKSAPTNRLTAAAVEAQIAAMNERFYRALGVSKTNAPAAR